MKVRRIRYGANKQYAEYYGQDPATTEPRMFWRDWEEIDLFKEAEIWQLDNSHRFPGNSFMLRVPMIDPETGTDTDADGDRAVLRIQMIGGQMDFIGGRPSFKGFVSLEELDHEEAYRATDLDGCLDAYDRARANSYVREEWQVVKT